MSLNDEAFVKEKQVRALTERMIDAVNALEFDPSMVGEATSAALSALASAGAANTDRVATEAARDVALAQVDLFEAPAKAVLDDIMGGDVAGLVPLMGRAKFATADERIFVSPTGSDANDGLSPGLPKLTAHAAQAALPNGRGCISLSGGLHNINNLELTSGLTIEGVGYATFVIGGDVFQVTQGQLVQDVHVRNMSILPTVAAFAVRNGGLALSVFEDLYINPTEPTACAIYAVALVDTKWRFHIETASTTVSTVPLVNLVATTANADAIACNSFTGRATHKSSYVFHIEDATGASYAENNRIWDFNFEVPNSGAVKILSGTGNVLDNCVGLDFDATVNAPLIYIGKSATSAKPSVSNRVNWHRHGGSLSATGWDVELESGKASQTTLIDCWADAGGYKSIGASISAQS